MVPHAGAAADHLTCALVGYAPALPVRSYLAFTVRYLKQNTHDCMHKDATTKYQSMIPPCIATQGLPVDRAVCRHWGCHKVRC